MGEQNGSSWSHTTLGELLREVEVRVRNLPSNESANLEVLSLTKNWGLIPQTERFDKRVATEDISKYKVVRPGWIVYNPYVIWEGAVHALRRSEPGVVSPVYPVFERTEDDGGFLDFVLRTDALIDAYNQLSSGAVNRRRSIKKNDFLGIEINVPPLPEQRAIAHVLRTVQQAKEATEKVIAATRQLKQSLMRHLFTYGPVPFDQADQVKLKETEIGLVPEHWDVAELGRYTRHCAFGPRFSGELYDLNGNVATLRTTDISDEGRINYATMPKARLPEAKFVDHFLTKGNFLVTRSGTCGIASVFEGFHVPVLAGAFLIRFVLSDDLSPYFLRDYFNSPVGRSRVLSIASGAVQKNISGTSLKQFIILIPLLADQHQIIAQLAAVGAKLAAEETRCDALDALFQSLLHHLMTGKVRVHDLDLPAIEKITP